MAGAASALAAPANDNFANAAILVGSPATATGSNVGATAEAGEPDHDSSGTNSVWYSWIAPSSGHAKVDLCGSDFDTVLGIYTGTSPAQADLTFVGSDDDGQCDDTSEVSFEAVAGTKYMIAVAGFSEREGSIQITARMVQAPANDNFAAAVTVSGSSFDLEGTTEGATKEGGEANHAEDAGGASVWYRWQAPATARYTLETCDTDYDIYQDTLLAVYTGGAVQSAQVVAFDEDAPACEGESQLRFSAVQGQTYHFAVDSHAGEAAPYTGPFGLHLRPTPVNDDFASPSVLSGSSATVHGTNVGATPQTGEPEDLWGGRSLWYSWTAPASGTTTVNTCGSDAFWALLGVYTVDAGGTPGLIAFDDSESPDSTCAAGPSASASFNAVKGTTYRIALDALFPQEGTQIQTGDVTINLVGQAAAVADRTAPNTTITAAPKAKTKKKTARVSFRSTESPARFQCALDAKAFATCSSPSAFALKKPGKHTIRVRAIDAAGNVDATPASASVKLVKKKG
jgi:hypothetical protein